MNRGDARCTQPRLLPLGISHAITRRKLSYLLVNLETCGFLVGIMSLEPRYVVGANSIVEVE